jgi:hypothetical protein
MGDIIILHVRKSNGRSTVSMERTLADLLSIYLCGNIDLSVVAKWCQDELEKDPRAYDKGASQRLSSKAVLTVAPKVLEERYWDLVLAKKAARPRGGGRQVRRQASLQRDRQSERRTRVNR